MAVSIALLFFGFISPPQGKIDASVIQACFLILIYPTLYTVFILVLRGINVHWDIKNGHIMLNKEQEDEIKIEENTKKQ